VFESVRLLRAPPIFPRTAGVRYEGRKSERADPLAPSCVLCERASDLNI
jgi:hypothetical protein